MKTGKLNIIGYVMLAFVGFLTTLQANPEINITNFPANPNFIPILDGDDTPRALDGTDFGSAAVTGGVITKTFRIRNNGDENLIILNGNDGDSDHFTITGLPSPVNPIAPGDDDTFFITFNPTTDGQHTTTITIVNNDDDPGDTESLYEFDVTGEGLGNPEIVVEGRHHTLANYNNIEYQQTDIGLPEGTLFTSAQVGSTETNNFRIRNTGDGTLTYTVSDGSSPHFRFSGLGTSREPGQIDQFNIIFDPQDYGTHEATITISNNDSNESNYTFKVQGTGLAPDIFVRGGPTQAILISDGDDTPRTSDGTDFGDHDVDGGTILNNFDVRNNFGATEDLTVYSAAITGADDDQFSIIGLPAPGGVAVTIPDGGRDGFTVFFNPTSEGQKKATVSILSDDPDETPYTFDITGNGVAFSEAALEGAKPQLPYVKIPDGSTIPMATNGTAFDNTDVGSTLTYNFKMSNLGAGTLTCSPPADGQFRVIGLDDEIPPGGEDIFFVRFAPTIPGVHTVTINIDTNDPNQDPYDFVVTGTAIDNEITVLGQGVEIENRRTSTNTSDGTHFGDLHILGESDEHTFHIRNEASSNKALSIQSVEITGGDASHFTTSGAPKPGQPAIAIAPGVSFPFTVTFNPGSTGLKTATVRILNDDSDETPYFFNVSGNGISGPNLRVRGSQDPNVLPYVDINNGSTIPMATNGTQFDTTLVGQSDLNYIRVWNAGNQDLVYSVTSSNNTDFVVSNVDSPLSAIKEDIVHVTFTPQSTGTKTSTITISSNDADEDPYTFLVRGTAQAPEIDVRGGSGRPPIEIILNGDDTPIIRDGTLFDDEEVTGGVDTNSFRIINQGSSPLTILTGVMEVGEHFTLSGIPLAPSNQIPPRGDLTFNVTFNPQWDGVHRDTVRLINTDTDEGMFEFDVEGTGLGDPEISVDGRANDNLGSNDPFHPITRLGTITSTTNGTLLENTEVGEHNRSLIRVSNSGDGILNFSFASDNPDFIVDTDPKFAYPGEDGIYILRFTPTDHGLRSATITITNNDSNENPYSFRVSGLGLGEDLDVKGGADLDVDIVNGDTTPSDLERTDFGDVELSGESITREFKLVNAGNSPLQFVSMTSSHVDFECGMKPNLASYIAPAPLGEHVFTITYNPSSLGARTATITILTSDPNESPYTFSVRGNGIDSSVGPEMEIRGGSGFAQVISAGDNSPSTADGTDFGTVDEGSGLITKTFQMKNVGTANLINIQGVSNLPDDVPVNGVKTSLTPDEADTFTVTIDSNTPGLHTAIIGIFSNDPNESTYLFTVQLNVTPTNPAPPEISSIDVSGEDGDVSFETEVGKDYKITTSTTMEGVWTQVPGTSVIPGTGNLETIEFTVTPGEQRRFYRLEVE